MIRNLQQTSQQWTWGKEYLLTQQAALNEALFQAVVENDQAKVNHIIKNGLMVPHNSPNPNRRTELTNLEKSSIIPPASSFPWLEEECNAARAQEEKQYKAAVAAAIAARNAAAEQTQQKK